MKQNDDPKEDPFTNIHLLIKRFQVLKRNNNILKMRGLLLIRKYDQEESPEAVL